MYPAFPSHSHHAACASYHLRVFLAFFQHLSLLLSIGHFWVASSLCFKARLSAKPLLWNFVIIIILIQIKLIFTTEVLPLASFCRWEVLELGNGVFLSVSSRCFSPLMILWSFAGSSYIVPRLISLTKRCVWSLCGELLNQGTSHPRRVETIAVLFSYLVMHVFCTKGVCVAFAGAVWWVMRKPGDLLS